MKCKFSISPHGSRHTHIHNGKLIILSTPSIHGGLIKKTITGVRCGINRNYAERNLVTLFVRGIQWRDNFLKQSQHADSIDNDDF